MNLPFAIGHDIVDISRIEAAIARHPNSFLLRIFTEKERAYCKKYKKSSALHFAGRFAAKEAIVKALGIGFAEGITWQDMEILPDQKGKPIVSLSQKLRQRFPPLTVQISISHTETIASAVALITRAIEPPPL